MTSTTATQERAQESVSLRYRIPWRSIGIYLAAFAAAVYLLVPFAWIFLTSFMTEAEALSVPPNWIPENPTLQNYQGFVSPSEEQQLVGSRAVQQTPRALLNSTIVAVSTALLNLFLATFAAYSFARLRFRGSQFLMVFYLLTRMVPGVAIIIPFFLVLRTLNLLDTYWAMILAYTTFTLPFTIWILKDYFRTISRDLEDAARIDGCNWISMIWRIFIPISAPGLVAASIFSFMLSWREFLFALFISSSISTRPISIVVANFATDLEVQFTFMAAAGVLAVIPPLILALIFQRMIVQGLQVGSVKG